MKHDKLKISRPRIHSYGKHLATYALNFDLIPEPISKFKLHLPMILTELPVADDTVTAPTGDISHPVVTA
jgi:hypothetical protein